jgi:hypothetical protein
MSRIIVAIENVVNMPAALERLKQITGFRPRELRHRLETHTVVAEYRLFHDDHAKIAGKLRRLMREIPETVATCRFYEVEPGEAFTTRDEIAQFEISSEIVENILCAHEAGLARTQANSEHKD